LAYIFDPIRNTFVDDEDTSLGNKLALVDDDELDKAIKQIELEQGPGTVFPASEAPTPPKTIERDMFKNAFKESAADGGMMRKNFADNPLKNFNTTTESIDFFVNKFGKNVLDNIALEKFGVDFNTAANQEDPKGAFKNFKKRLVKFEDFIIENNRMPTETEARKIGRIQRDKTITGTGKKEITEEDIRNKLIKNNKPAETFRSKVIFADKNIQNEFEAELTKRYSFPRTSAAAEAAGVLNNQQIYEKFLKPAGYGFDSTRTIINNYKKFLDLDFQELTSEQKEAKKLERDKGEKISQGGRRISGTVDNPVHHMFPLGDQIGAKVGEFTIIPKSINGKIAYANKQMKKLVLERGKLLDQVKIDTAFPKGLDKKLANINKKAEEVIKNHYKKYPSHKGLLNWKKIDFVTDDVGRLLNVRQIGTIGGDYQKWTLANIDKTILDKKVANLSDEELRNFRQVINETSVARDAGDKGFGAKEGTPIKNLFTSLKNKLDTSRMFTSRIPGGAIALAPADFILSMGAGMPLLESAASAGSYLIKDPYLGKAVNIPLAIAQDMQDPETALQKGIERGQKAEDFLQGLVEDAKGGAGDQPDIDPFQAAKGGRAKLNKGGGVEITPLPRTNFNGGGAVGADDNFAKELEYFLLNPEAELPKADSYRETMNPVSLLNDMIDPRNYAYYADRLAESGVRIGEFGARVLPALGQLTADLIQRPAFKVTGGTGKGYVQDYTDVMPSNIKGTGIFSEFLDNLVGSEGTKVITEKTGLANLIRSEEQKQKDRRSTIGPKVLADQVTLGAELTAPIFPGLKLLKAYAKNRKLPVNNTTKQILEKEIDEVLSTQNLTRRDFLKATGAGGAVVLAKMLGFGDELATTTKVAEKAVKETASGGVPPYFLNLVKKIKTMGDETMATKDKATAYKYDDYYMEEDFAGNIEITRKGDMDVPGYEEVYMSYRIDEVPIKGEKNFRKVEEYEEYTARPDMDGKMKDVEDGVPDDVIEEGTIFEDDITNFGK
jgi:hypothetical protein